MATTRIDELEDTQPLPGRRFFKGKLATPQVGPPFVEPSPTLYKLLNMLQLSLRQGGNILTRPPVPTPEQVFKERRLRAAMQEVEALRTSGLDDWLRLNRRRVYGQR